ncbi:hypothetical protein [Streptomyces sp. NPDC001165]|uniref:hypothetical protein n=1 Tax=Streptomyces sp. NPDC001165 TaxID=3364546 RepID=UPI003680A5B4
MTPPALRHSPSAARLVEGGRCRESAFEAATQLLTSRAPLPGLLPGRDEPLPDATDTRLRTAAGLHAAAEGDLQEGLELGTPEAGTISGATQHYAVAAASWLESCGPDWRPFDAGDWQDAARLWHHTTGLPIHPTVQNLLYERHGPASLTATRELDDLAEAIQYAGHPWTGRDLIDLATVTLAAMHHSAHPGLNNAAFAYLDRLAARPSPISSAGFSLDDTSIGKPLWTTPAAGLAQHAGIDSCGLRDSLAEIENALTNSRAPTHGGALDFVNARALELAAAASRVIRARCERDPKAEDRLKTIAHRRLLELAHVARAAVVTRAARRLPTSTEMTISMEQMRTALIEEHYSSIERRRHQQPSTADAHTSSCNGRTSPHPIEAPVPQRPQAAMEDQA